MMNRRWLSKSEALERWPKSMITPEQMAKAGDESSEQKAVFCWAALSVGKYPQLKWLHAIPNANSHRQVAEGVRGGVSDIMLPWPKQRQDAHGYVESFKYGYHGLYIEMKIEKRRNQKNGGCSEDQIAFQEYANSVGYKAIVCYGWKEAVVAIEGYLND